MLNISTNQQQTGREEILRVYENRDLFFRNKNRLLDTINDHFPEIEKIYILQRAKDWTERDVPLDNCKLDFKSCDPKIKDLMISVLAYQWETDTEVSRTIIGAIENFNPADVLLTAWIRIQDNERIHARTYSEIVKYSFDNPNEVILMIEKIKFAQKRLQSVAKIFEQTRQVSAKLVLGLLTFSDEVVIDTLILFLVALYATERIQFIASFSVSFTITKTGLFQPIQELLQKICADEYEVHQKLDSIVLSLLKKDPRYISAFERNKQTIKAIVDEVVESEKVFLDVAFENDIELPGADKNDFFNFVLYQAKAVYALLEIQTDYVFPKVIPLSHMRSFLNIDMMENAIQEKKSTNYTLGNIINNHHEELNHICIAENDFN